MPDLERPIKKIGWLLNVDVLGGGGLVPVPPSCVRMTHKGKFGGETWESYVEYEWAKGCHLPDRRDLPRLPPEFVEDLITRAPTISTREGEIIRMNAGDTLPPTADFVRQGFGWYEGSRDRECFRLARRLIGKLHGNRQLVERRLYEIYEKTEKIKAGDPFTWGDVVKCLDSAWRWWEKDNETRIQFEANFRMRPSRNDMLRRHQP
jgi:hypothetical protein